MNLPKAALGAWKREFHSDYRFDLGSSGVRAYSFSSLQNQLEITQDELDAISFGIDLTAEDLSLRVAIANRWGSGAPEKVMITNGSNEILYFLMSALLKSKDEVVVLDPIYRALSTVAESIGCRMIRWKLQANAQFKPSIEELERLITPQTRMVCVNFPHNPTGITLTKEEQEELLEITSKVGAYLVWDAAFGEMTDSPLPNPQIKYDNAISVGTLSKGYGLPGMRVGWCLASPKILAHCKKIQGYTTAYISPLIEFLAQKVVEKADIFLRPRMVEARKNMKLFKKWIQEHEEFAIGNLPQGGVTSLIKLLDVSDTKLFCRELLLNYGVMLVPGECFDQPGYVRLGYGCSTNDFEEGIERFSQSLQSHHFYQPKAKISTYQKIMDLSWQLHPN